MSGLRSSNSGRLWSIPEDLSHIRPISGPDRPIWVDAIPQSRPTIPEFRPPFRPNSHRLRSIWGDLHQIWPVWANKSACIQGVCASSQFRQKFRALERQFRRRLLSDPPDFRPPPGDRSTPRERPTASMSREFLGKVWGSEAGVRFPFRHILCFAARVDPSRRRVGCTYGFGLLAAQYAGCTDVRQISGAL